MKVNTMDKYQLTKLMKEVKEYITRPDVYFSHLRKEDIKEILNPPTDKDGYVHKYYLTESTKMLIEIISDVLKKKSRSQ
ncbi:hypothetical protein [Lysinibacillus xylanilyticus]|uniref:hypothetical protein n=1 Tax=Lysinibacillus xylanilyticus TaxID=582475 RepID=UPI003D0933AB